LPWIDPKKLAETLGMTPLEAEIAETQRWFETFRFYGITRLYAVR